MQGFNKYYPPDFNPETHGSLNAYQGKHALGDRARKINQGILITRFELPFNIWCGTCDSHIGMGVRYNAEKKKIGSYYSTPIFSFRCKCHLCSGWFEIQTDPKNTRYVVASGARQKDEEWNPEENGGFAIHDTNGQAAGPSDPLAALEKYTDAANYSKAVQAPRLEALQAVSDVFNADPYTHSKRVRARFRAEKKVEQARTAVDKELKDRYALPETLKLIRDDEASIAAAREEWRQANEAKRANDLSQRGSALKAPIGSRSLSASSSSRSRVVSPRDTVLASLRERILENTARRNQTSVGRAAAGTFSKPKR